MADVIITRVRKINEDFHQSPGWHQHQNHHCGTMTQQKLLSSQSTGLKRVLPLRPNPPPFLAEGAGWGREEEDEEEGGAWATGAATGPAKVDGCTGGWRDRSSLNTEFIWRLISSWDEKINNVQICPFYSQFKFTQKKTNKGCSFLDFWVEKQTVCWIWV